MYCSYLGDTVASTTLLSEPRAEVMVTHPFCSFGLLPSHPYRQDMDRWAQDYNNMPY